MSKEKFMTAVCEVGTAAEPALAPESVLLDLNNAAVELLARIRDLHPCIVNKDSADIKAVETSFDTRLSLWTEFGESSVGKPRNKDGLFLLDKQCEKHRRFRRFKYSCEVSMVWTASAANDDCGHLRIAAFVDNSTEPSFYARLYFRGKYLTDAINRLIKAHGSEEVPQ